MNKRRAAGEGGLFKRKDGMWVGSYEVQSSDGRRRQKRVYAKSYAKAKDKLKALRDDIESGFVPTAPTTTVEKWLPHWLDTIHGPTVRPKTRAFYEEAIRLHIIPGVGSRRLSQLTAEHIREMLRGIPSTRNKQRAYQTLNLGLKAAVVNGLMKRNPCEAVTKPKHLANTRGAFTADQAKAIIRTAIALEEAGVLPRVATRWALAFLTGARQSELLGLEWDRVDLEGARIDLSWQLQQLKKAHGCGNTCGRVRPSYCPQAKWDFPDGYEYRDCYKSLVWTRPKTTTGIRVVKLLPEMVAVLQHQRAFDGPNPYGLVWHHNDGRPIAPTDDHEMWQTILIAAGVTRKGQTIPMHSIRHSTATLLQDAGVDEPVRMAIMGHSSVAAQRGYLHVDERQQLRALQNLAPLLPPV